MNTLNQSIKAHFLYLSAIFVSILLMIVLKYSAIGNHLNVYQSIFYKTTIFSVLFTPFYIKYFKIIKLKDIYFFVFTVLCGIYDAYAMNFCWTKLPVNNIVILVFLSPFVMSSLAFIFLKEKIYLKTIIAMLICFLGVIISINWKMDNKNNLFWYGVLFSNLIISGIGWILLKKLTQKGYSSSFISYIRILAISITSFFMIDSLPNMNYTNMTLIIIMSCGYIYERITFAKAYSMTDVSKLQPLKFTNIIFSSILGYIILGEKITKHQSISICIVATAMGLLYVNFNKKISVNL